MQQHTEPGAADRDGPADADESFLDDLFEVASGPLGREPLHLPPFATFRSRPGE